MTVQLSGAILAFVATAIIGFAFSVGLILYLYHRAAPRVVTSRAWTLNNGDFRASQDCVVCVLNTYCIDRLPGGFPYVVVDEKRGVVVIPKRYADHSLQFWLTRWGLRGAEYEAAVQRATETRVEDWKGSFRQEGWTVLRATKSTTARELRITLVNLDQVQQMSRKEFTHIHTKNVCQHEPRPWPYTKGLRSLARRLQHANLPIPGFDADQYSVQAVWVNNWEMDAAANETNSDRRSSRAFRDTMFNDIERIKTTQNMVPQILEDALNSWKDSKVDGTNEVGYWLDKMYHKIEASSWNTIEERLVTLVQSVTTN